MLNAPVKTTTQHIDPDTLTVFEDGHVEFETLVDVPAFPIGEIVDATSLQSSTEGQWLNAISKASSRTATKAWVVIQAGTTVTTRPQTEITSIHGRPMTLKAMDHSKIYVENATARKATAAEAKRFQAAYDLRLANADRIRDEHRQAKANNAVAVAEAAAHEGVL